MTLKLSNLKPAKGARTTVKRLGRGNASGKGTTAGKGTKGQRARTGGRNRIQLLGMRRLILSTPKLRGFQSFKKRPVEVKLAVVAKEFADGALVSPKSLIKKGLVPAGTAIVKILSQGETKKKLNFEGCLLTEAAKAKVLAAGGEVR